jgi:hypothetical protein
MSSSIIHPEGVGEVKEIKEMKKGHWIGMGVGAGEYEYEPVPETATQEEIAQAYWKYFGAYKGYRKGKEEEQKKEEALAKIEEGIAKPKTWEEFRATGLLYFINRFLHIFGWSIVLDVDTETQKTLNVYPARANWRGFSSDGVTNAAYGKITRYMAENIEELLEEVQS